MEEKLRFDIITYVVKSLGAPGKIMVQKTLYFLQEEKHQCDDDNSVAGIAQTQCKEQCKERRQKDGRVNLEVLRHTVEAGYHLEWPDKVFVLYLDGYFFVFGRFDFT